MPDINTDERDRTDRPGSYEQLYREVAPSVVSIYTIDLAAPEALAPGTETEN